MSVDSSVTIAGDVTRGPIRVVLPSGDLMAKLTVSTVRIDRHGGKHPSDVDVDVYGAQAENVLGSLTKGARVLLWGAWETDVLPGGETKVRVVASEVAASLKWANVDIVKGRR